MKKLTDEEFDALAATKPDADVERADDDEMGLHVVVRGPGRLEWKQFRADLAKAEDAYDPQWRFVAAMTLHPNAQELAQFLDRKPGALYTIMRVLNWLSGIRETIETKKPSRA